MIAPAVAGMVIGVGLALVVPVPSGRMPPKPAPLVEVPRHGQSHIASRVRVTVLPDEASTSGIVMVAAVDVEFGEPGTALVVSELIDQAGVELIEPDESPIMSFEESPSTLNHSTALPPLPDGKYLLRATAAAVAVDGSAEEAQIGLFYFQVVAGEVFALEDLNEWY